MDFAPLRHPVWWMALVVLLVNDHLLKGEQILPSWMTGKLSDFAFLIVAPVLLTCLLPRRLRGRRVVAFVFVAGLFTLANLSPAVSRCLVDVLAWVGVRWRLWPDASDVVALLVLPVGWHIVRDRGPSADRGRRRVEATAVLLGAAACIATSAPPSFHHFPFFVNQTSTEQVITFMWMPGRTPCDVDLAMLAQNLTTADLAQPHVETIVSGQVAALDEEPGPQTVLAGKCHLAGSAQGQGGTDAAGCMAAVVSVSGGPAVLMVATPSWMESYSGPMISCGSQDVPSLCATQMSLTHFAGPDALALRVTNGKLVFRAGKKLRTVPIDLALVQAKLADPSGCRSKQETIRGLVAGAEGCVHGSDCQVIRAALPYPFGPTCDLYVNRSLSADVLETHMRAWEASCLTSQPPVCTGRYVQPPECRSGKCAPACPFATLPACASVCPDSGTVAGMPCAQLPSRECYLPDGRFCRCSDVTATLDCTYATSPSGACALTCASYVPVVAGNRELPSIDGGIDGGGIDVVGLPDSRTP